MTEATFRCSNCGAALDSPDSICLRCDPELQPPNRDPNIGKYRCPSCSCRFDSPIFTLWPPTAKWYVPQGSRLTCPHCGKHLRDRRVVERTPIELGVAVLIVVASLFSPWRPGTQYVLLIVILAVELLRTWRAKQSVAHAEERYAVTRDS
jgi:DNA-directed RNA polymerase subunit RPC12/RpoP